MPAVTLRGGVPPPPPSLGRLLSQSLMMALPPAAGLRSFLVCGEGQLQDLHSKLRLDHPHGEASQLHK